VSTSDAYPEKLAELRELSDREARRNGVYPLMDAGSPREATTEYRSRSAPFNA